MSNYSFISNADPVAIEQLYESYSEDVASVDESWQLFFRGYDFFNSKNGENVEGDLDSHEVNLRDYIHAFRSRGHLKSNTNPIRPRRKHNEKLEAKEYGLDQSPNDLKFQVGENVGMRDKNFNEINAKLENIYGGSIGFEYMHIRNHMVTNWFSSKIEKEYYNLNLDLDIKKRILEKLNEAVIFENFLHTKYLGQKRFSLEGCENTIPALDTIIQDAGKIGLEEVVIGMAHRGRLNVLSNIMGKTYEEIFNEFEGNQDPNTVYGSGDVKYHLGYSSYINSGNGKKLYVKLAPNPSHLESVSAVVLGYVRAQMDEEYDGNDAKVLPIIIHGDAAIAGQGLVYETVQMSQLEGYITGGTIHIVINNQVGFTTDYKDARSAIYCTDIAKIVDAPVLHINADDAEAVVFGARLALEYRTTFKKDVFLDLLGYRRYGHNESDEPKFTQPLLYSLIEKHKNSRDIYIEKLDKHSALNKKLAQEMEVNFRKDLQDRLNNVKQQKLEYKTQKIENDWKELEFPNEKNLEVVPHTAITKNQLDKVAKVLITTKPGFKPLKQIVKLLKERKENFYTRKKLNWADAELLAYGSLILEGANVRMSGQDVKRGTFSHRHAFVTDMDTNEPYNLLEPLNSKEGELHMYNSLLSEYGVLGFEYGYAMASPHTLVIWEAQFGDFANGAQVIIDQFITSAFTKWQKMNGLVMLLPHGYEGQGPEHSSARLERYLQACAENNVYVTNLTTPANLFHALRRQLKSTFRMPLINMAPKSLLRHPKVVSPLNDFTEGKFQKIIKDDYVKATKVSKMICCTGKAYYDLLDFQQKNKREDVAIIRVEQLYPIPEKLIMKEFNKYNNVKYIHWVQEEPENMGAYMFFLRKWKKTPLKVISRVEAASPATGFSKTHALEQKNLIEKAFE